MPPENKEKVNMKDPNPIELKPCAVKKVYEEYKHLDKLFSDHFIYQKDIDNPPSPTMKALFDMWKAIKEFNNSPSEPPKPIEWPKEPSINQYNDDFGNGVNIGRRLMYMEFMLAIRAYEGRNSK